MTTPRDIINLAFKDSGVLGVGQTAQAEDMNDCLLRINFMLSQWARKRWLVYHLVTVSKVSTGATSYTIGTGGDFNTPRPDRLESAFFRQTITSSPNKIDYPLEIIESRETYNNIALKSLASFPSYVFYDSAYPTGTLYFYPNPQASLYEMFVSVKEALPRFTSLSQNVNLPEEYHAALLHNTVVRLRSAYQLPPDPIQIGLAKDSLAVVRGANTQISRLRVPADLLRPGVYNPYSDQIR